MRRLLPLLFLLLAACGDKPPPSGNEGPTPNIRGTLTVHTFYRDLSSSTSIQSAYVLLGDGSRFRQPIDDQGTARFEDPSIVGPQDVTIVVVSKSGYRLLYTLLAVDEPELHYDFSGNPGPSGTRQATVKGKVTGATGTGSVKAVAVGEGFSSQPASSSPPPGGFELEVLGSAPGRVSLFASEFLPAGLVDTTQRVGEASPVTVKLLRPLLLSSPSLGTEAAPGTATRDGLVFRWSADPTARFVKLSFGPSRGSTPLLWFVMAPVSITSFTPFALPSEVAPQTTLDTGLYAIDIQSLDYGEGVGVEDSIRHSVNPDPLREERKTRVLGYVVLQ